MTTVRNHNLKRNRQGSAIIWILVWLTGLALIAWAGYTFAIPRYEQRVKAAVHDAIAGHTDMPIIIAAKGNVVTLTGQAATAETLSAITDAAANTAGVRAVKTNLTLVSASQHSESIPSDVEQAAQLDVTVQVIDPDTDAKSVDPTPDTDVTQSPSQPIVVGAGDEPDNKSDTDNTEAPSEADSQGPNENASIVASASQPTELPTFKMRIVDEILMIEGRMSNNDDTNELIQNAMTSFNVDVVSNGIAYSDDVAKAEWLESIEGVMPLMGLINDPQISVLERQITLIGAAPNREVHDDVISQALNSLGEFSLVERVSINPVPENTEVATADAELTTTASDSPNATPVEEAIEVASTIEADSDVSIETESLVKTEAPLDPIDPTPPPAPMVTKTVVEPVASADPEAPLDTEAAVESAAAEKPDAQVATEEAVELVASAETEAPLDTEAAVESAASEKPDAPVATEEAVESAASAKPEAPLDTEAPVESAASEKTDAPVATESAAVSVASAEPEDTGTVPAITKQAVPNEKLRTALSELPTLRILFETDVNVLTTESQHVLDQIADALMRFPDTGIAIEGHTDASGDQKLNLELSLLRATTVRDYLIDKGVSVYNLRALGFGEELPIADNQTAEGRAINRRIEFTF